MPSKHKVGGSNPPVRSYGSADRVWLATPQARMQPEAPAAMAGASVRSGLLLGFGVKLGSGCTSGHGVCGIGRRSPRSIIATVTFMATGIATVYVVRHVLGGL